MMKASVARETDYYLFSYLLGVKFGLCLTSNSRDQANDQMKVGLDGTVEKMAAVRKKREGDGETQRGNGSRAGRSRSSSWCDGHQFGCGWRGGRLR